MAIHPDSQRYAGFTTEGGFAVKMINKTGAASVKGTVVDSSSTTDFAFGLEEAESLDPIGVVYEDGIADGAECWIVTHGLVDVLLEDGTAATRSYWVKTSENQDGRADASNDAPAGGTVQALEDHFQEIGHCQESVSAGTNKLCRILFHTN